MQVVLLVSYLLSLETFSSLLEQRLAAQHEFPGTALNSLCSLICLGPILLLSAGNLINDIFHMGLILNVFLLLKNIMNKLCMCVCLAAAVRDSCRARVQRAETHRRGLTG